MKIAVYTIALNEEKHVERWYESAKDADYLLIADTGSTDKTKRIAKKLGIKVIDISISPWRFDDARNAALAALPTDIDYCISMDMDETLSEGWRECLEKMTGDQIEYKFNLDFKDEEEKNPETTFINNRIHKRYGFRWEYLMHEVLFPSRGFQYKLEFCEGLEVSHHPDIKKPRSQYNKMIEDAYHEYGNARYNLYYLAELAKFERIDEAKTLAKKMIKLADMGKIDISLVYKFLGDISENFKVYYYLKALKVFPTRETYTTLSVLYYKKEKWLRAYYFAKKADAIKIKTKSILFYQGAWGHLPFNIMSSAKHNLKLFKFSKNYKSKRKDINVYSPVSHKFRLFND
jgi:glycosyltransferase involved in cell wall biosynthesis